MAKTRSVRDLLRVPVGAPAPLAAVDPDSTPAFKGGKSEASDAMAALHDPLTDLQVRLFAEQTRSVLLLLQGMDTSGKGGAINDVAKTMNPAWCEVTSFKRPTKVELAHHFLWRIKRATPQIGEIGIFDRSHYEDVLIVRVHGYVPPDVIEGRYGEINAWEAKLAASGVTVVKCMLHISYEEQRERLIARLDRPDKHWKFNEADIDERAHWEDYQLAYNDALRRCSTVEAPWYVVPADRKWYRSWAITTILLETLRDLDPQFPRPDLDVAQLKSRLVPPG